MSKSRPELEKDSDWAVEVRMVKSCTFYSRENGNTGDCEDTKCPSMRRAEQFKCEDPVERASHREEGSAFVD
jgi:hypothetical protein